MNKHAKKIIAPAVITVLVVAYLAVNVVTLLGAEEYNPWFLLPMAAMAALGAGMIYVLIVRIKEIRSGEEDDLDNY